MPREADPSTSEADFVLKALRSGIRTDGRTAYDSRPAKLSFGDELGWVECRLGETRVVVQVSAEIVKPLVDRPYEGFLVISTEISPMASSSYEAGRASDEEVVLARLLEKALRKSEAVDREALCIVAGQKVWSIRVDVHFLDDEGNMLDCASVAAITALRHFRRPDVTVIGEEVTVHSMSERVPVPLAIHHSPFCQTFAFFGDESLCVLDPTHLESLLASGTLTVTLNSQQEICVLSKAGGSPLPADDIMKVVQIGIQRVRDLDAMVKAALEREAKRRIVEARASPFPSKREAPTLDRRRFSLKRTSASSAPAPLDSAHSHAHQNQNTSPAPPPLSAAPTAASESGMAAVMRAMTGSMSGLSKTRSRSEAPTPTSTFEASTSPPNTANDLARVTSRLVPPGSTAPTSAGILINSNRPYGAHSSAASSVTSLPRTPSATDLTHLHASAVSPRSRSSSPSPLPSSSSHLHLDSAPPSPLPSPHDTDLDRGRSRSSSRHGHGTGGPSTDSTSTRMSIRFAPLPEVRQRSYSTGRNIWLEDDDISEMTAGVDGPPRKWERRDQPEVEMYSDSALADSSSGEEDDKAHNSTGIFGSWKSDLMGGAKDEATTSPSSSYTAKLLRPLAFGLGKKKSSSSSSKGRPRTSDASDLSRVESNESSLSRGSMDGGGTFKSTGVPMRKTRTWELGDTAASSASGSRRHAYPSVAQRSKNARSSNSKQSVSAPDPSFVEWGWGKQGSGQGVGSVRSAKAVEDSNNNDGEGEDGGGMAWVRRRKAEREAAAVAAAAAAKQKEEDEASAAASTTLTAEPLPIVDLAASDDILDPTPASGTTTPIALSPVLPSTTPASLLSSTRPALRVITPTLTTSTLLDPIQPSSPTPSRTTASRSSSSISTPSNKSSSSASTSEGEDDDVVKPVVVVGAASSGLVVPAVTKGGASDDGDDSDEEEDREDDDEDSDLDEEELAQEEALAEHARMTSKSAASERFSDANHKTRMLKVDSASS